MVSEKGSPFLPKGQVIMFSGGTPLSRLTLSTVKLIILKEDNLNCLDIFKTQPGPVVKNATLGHPAGNRTRDLANLVRCSESGSILSRIA